MPVEFEVVQEIHPPPRPRSAWVWTIKVYAIYPKAHKSIRRDNLGYVAGFSPSDRLARHDASFAAVKMTALVKSIVEAARRG